MLKTNLKHWIRIGGISATIILLALVVRIIAIAKKETQRNSENILSIELPEKVNEVSDTNLIEKYSKMIEQQQTDSLIQVEAQQKSLQAKNHLHKLLPHKDSTTSPLSEKQSGHISSLTQYNTKKKSTQHQPISQKEYLQNQPIIKEDEKAVGFNTGFYSVESHPSNSLIDPIHQPTDQKEILSSPSTLKEVNKVLVTLIPQTIESFNTVELRLEENVPKYELKKGEIILAKGKIYDEYAVLEVRQIRFKGKLIQVSFPCYSNNGTREISLEDQSNEISSYQNDEFNIKKDIADQAYDELTNRLPATGILETGKSIIENIIKRKLKAGSEDIQFYVPTPQSLYIQIP